MAYVGRSAPKLYFDAFVKDTFDGDGTTTSFSLSKSPGNVNSLLVAVDNVIQEPGVAFTLSDNTLTFTGAPSNGSDNIYACFWGGTLTIAETSTVKTANTATITGNLTPTSNVVFSLGQPASAWKELWLDGNSLHLGNTSISIGKTGEVEFMKTNKLGQPVTSVDVANVHASIDTGGVLSFYSANTTGNVRFARGAAIGYANSKVPGANLDVKGNAVISGNVAISSATNYPDSSSGGVGRASFGTDNDLQVYHNGSNGYLRNDTGNMLLYADTFQFFSDTGDELFAQLNHNAAVKLYYDATQKFETTGTGVSISGLGANVAGNVSVARSLAVGYVDHRVPQANLEVTGNAVISGSSYPNAGAVGPLWTGRNWIMNGTGRINQRYGTSAQTAINQYAMDRWRTYGGALGYELKSESEARTVADSSPDGYYISFRRTDSQTNNTGVCQGIETKNSKQFAGRTACLSFKARKGANFSEASSLLTAHIRAGEGTDENPVGMTNMTTASKQFTLTTTWQKFFFTADIATDKTQMTVDFGYTPVGTVGADDSYDVTEIQLEIGSEPTPFEQIKYHDEVMSCLRYFRTYGPGLLGFWNGSSNIEFEVQFKPEMRATPTFAVINAAPTLSNKTNSGTATESGVAVVNSSGTLNGMYFIQTSGCTGTSPSAGDICQVRTDNFVSLDAEL